MTTFNSRKDEVVYSYAVDPLSRVDQIGVTTDLGWWARVDALYGFDWIVMESREGKVMVLRFDRVGEAVKASWTAIVLRHINWYREPRS